MDDIKNTLKKAELQQLGLKVELLLTIAELFRGIINQSYTTLRSQEVLVGVARLLRQYQFNFMLLGPE